MIDVVLHSQRIDGDVGGKVVAGGDNTAFQTQTGSYIGGQPVGLSTSGFVFGGTVDDTNYIGVFFNNSILDTNVGANVVGTTTDLTQALPSLVWKTGVKARLFIGTRHNVADASAPFATGVTWAVGDHLYLAATTGLWTNVSAAGRVVSHGRVIIPPATAQDVMEAELFDTPLS